MNFNGGDVTGIKLALLLFPFAFAPSSPVACGPCGSSAGDRRATKPSLFTLQGAGDTSCACDDRLQAVCPGLGSFKLGVVCRTTPDAHYSYHEATQNQISAGRGSVARDFKSARRGPPTPAPRLVRSRVGPASTGLPSCRGRRAGGRRGGRRGGLARPRAIR